MKLMIVIAQDGFQDTEFKVPYDHFLDHNIEVDIVSIKKGKCTGTFGLVMDANLSFEKVNPEDYDGIVIIGGGGSKTLVSNEHLEKILKNMQKRNVLISAICYSPVTLAKAGILEGKKATVWNNDGNQRPILEEKGAEYINQDVVIDNLIVTANGPHAAEDFAKAVVEVLNK